MKRGDVSRNIFVFVLYLVLNFCEIRSQDYQQSKTVILPQGRVHGLLKYTEYGTVRVFMGVPYARPPIGDLRLRPPEHASEFQDYNATFARPSCIQAYSTSSREDCLYLNIFTPTNLANKAPVMVYIHGGSFIMGTGSTFDATKLVARGKVVVVTINYRLGLLGFFPGGGLESNLGLRDQIMALKWVQKNIEYYDGNPNEVTAFGGSAGSQSVSFLSVSPKTKGLFKRAICQSGVAISPWFHRKDVNIRRQKLLEKGRELGCQSYDVVQCAKQIPIEKWQEFEHIFPEDVTPYTFPAVDNDIIMSDYATNKSRLHEGLDMIIGLNMFDGGTTIVLTCWEIYGRACDNSESFSPEELLVPLQLPEMDKDDMETLIKTYNNWYPHKAPDGEINIMAASELATDIQYRFPINKTASMGYWNGNNIYVYQFNVKPKVTTIPWASTWSKDADHAEELDFLFNLVGKDDPHYNVSLHMVDLWTDFAKGQMPSRWWPFEPRLTAYLLIDKAYQKGVARRPLISGQKNSFWREFEEHGVFPNFFITAGTEHRFISGGLATILTIVFTIYLS